MKHFDPQSALIDLTDLVKGVNARLTELSFSDLPPRRGPGRPKAPLRVKVRKDRGVFGIFQLHHPYGGPVSLYVSALRPDLLLDAVQLKLAELKAGETAKISPLDVPLSEILRHELACITPLSDATEEELAAAEQRGRRLARAIAFFGPKGRLGDIDEESCISYVNHILKTPNANAPSRILAKGSARIDLSWLRAAINRYRKSKHLAVVPYVWLPERSEPRRNWMTVGEVARLLRSALYGHVWDKAKCDWRREAVVDPATGAARMRRVVDPVFARGGEDARRRGRMLARFILVGLGTGTRHGVLLDLAWGPAPYRGWLDLDGGYVHRLGEKEPPSAAANKGRPTSALPAGLVRVAKAWRAEDRARGIRHVFHKPDGSPYRSGLLAPYKAAAKRAGLDDAIVHEMRHTTVTWCLINGGTISEAADLAGMTYETVESTYGHHCKERTRGGAEALEGRRVRSIKESVRDQLDDRPAKARPARNLAARMMGLAAIAGG